LDQFRTLEGSQATGSSGRLRLTNLMQLTIDSSWWTRYRSSTNNPDVNPTTFEQAVPTCIPDSSRLSQDGRRPVPHEHIKRSPTPRVQMPTVEQGGGSLRMALAQSNGCGSASPSLVWGQSNRCIFRPGTRKRERCVR
jgi:hypothetical protein